MSSWDVAYLFGGFVFGLVIGRVGRFLDRRATRGSPAFMERLVDVEREVALLGEVLEDTPELNRVLLKKRLAALEQQPGGQR